MSEPSGVAFGELVVALDAVSRRHREFLAVLEEIRLAGPFVDGGDLGAPSPMPPPGTGNDAGGRATTSGPLLDEIRHEERATVSVAPLAPTRTRTTRRDCAVSGAGYDYFADVEAALAASEQPDPPNTGGDDPSSNGSATTR